MKWVLIPKGLPDQPEEVDDYSKCKTQLSEEGSHQCVYCCITESKFGGNRNFHVEHYKPKSLDQFKHLINVYRNLFFACSICNCFKKNDWPNDPTTEFDTNSYIDPSETNYNEIFKINSNYELSSDYPAGIYMIHRLFLNRPQLKLLRKEYELYQNYSIIINEQIQILENLLKDCKSDAEKILINSNLDNAKGLLEEISFHNTVPYTEDQIKR